MSVTIPNDPTTLKGDASPEKGTYHCVVKAVDPEPEKYAGIGAVLEVLAGDPSGQAGKEIRHSMFFTDKGDYKNAHARFAWAAGIGKPGQSLDEVQWEQAEGAQVVACVDRNAKGFLNVTDFGCDIWPVGHPDVAAVPKDENALRLLGQPAEAAPAAAGSEGEWGKIANQVA